MTESGSATAPGSKYEYLDLLKSALCASLYDESAWRRVEGPMKQNSAGLVGRLKRAVLRGVVRSVESRGIMLVRRNKYEADARQQGQDWPLFGYTMTGRNRLDRLHECIEAVLNDGIPGDIVETGVWRGGSMILAAAILRAHGDAERRIWCCDSFEGMPASDRDPSLFEDFSDLEYLSVSLEQVQSNFRRFELLSDQVQFLKGWFCDTLASAAIEQIAVLRLDGDLYESTRDALVPLYPKVSRGGFVIIDDYNSWPGCKQAVNEYREAHRITAPLLPIDTEAVYWRVE